MSHRGLSTVERLLWSLVLRQYNGDLLKKRGFFQPPPSANFSAPFPLTTHVHPVLIPPKKLYCQPIRGKTKKTIVTCSHAFSRAWLIGSLRWSNDYSQLSANGHSHKPRTALLTDAFSNPRFTPQSNFLFTHSRKRTLSPKRTRTLLKMKIGFFFCSCSLVSGHLKYNN